MFFLNDRGSVAARTDSSRLSQFDDEPLTENDCSPDFYCILSHIGDLE